MKSKFLAVLIVIPLVSFAQKPYYKRELIEAWLQNNKKPFSEYIKYLENREYNDYFYDVIEMSTATNFRFGIIDPEDIKNEPDTIKSILKYNVLLVYKVYLNSCLFKAKEIPRDSLYYMQNDKRFNIWERKLSTQDIVLIKKEMSIKCMRQ